MNKNKTQFSFFEAPIANLVPRANITLLDAYRAITTEYLKETTQKLRFISNEVDNRKYKTSHFPYITPSGIFTKRDDNCIIEHSGYIAIDLDNLNDVEAVKMQLMKDIYFETELIFISPNGNGIKWIISIDVKGKYSHSDNFQAIRNYLKETYSLDADKSCKNVSRACFLCYDPTAWIHPKYLVE